MSFWTWTSFCEAWERHCALFIKIEFNLMGSRKREKRFWFKIYLRVCWSGEWKWYGAKLSETGLHSWISLMTKESPFPIIILKWLKLFDSYFGTGNTVLRKDLTNSSVSRRQFNFKQFSPFDSWKPTNQPTKLNQNKHQTKQTKWGKKRKPCQKFVVGSVDVASPQRGEQH